MKLNYKRIGEGKPFIILHGLFGSLDNWSTHQKKIAEYYDVICVDERNHGHSPWSDEFSYDLMAEDLKELFDELQLKDAIVLGHSMGGKTAMRFAQLYPELIEKLIVVDMGAKAYPMHHEVILEGLNAIDLSKVHSRKEAQEILSKYVPDFSVQQFLLKNLYWEDKEQLAWRMNIPVLEKRMPEILEALPEMENFTPTLFIRGEKSNYILESDTTQLEAYFPDCTIVQIANAGHWVHAEAPEIFIETVLEFCLR